MLSMRTTLTIEPDIAAEIERRRRDGVPLKRIVNRLLRRGIEADAEAPLLPPYRTRTFDLHLRPGVDELKLNQLVDELEADDFLARESARRR